MGSKKDAGARKGNARYTKHRFKTQSNNKPKDDDEIQRIRALADSIDKSTIKEFMDFPLSWKTQEGLRDLDYKIPTDIQLESLEYALQGRDILGSARTGSGKTLAFLIPVLEILFIKRWTRLDGIGALVISPTRELAYQTFETLNKIGGFHDFSAGLIIGGKNLKFERKRMDQCNIIICTPGRLLQHMDENPLFNASTMQILVIDEADRCLDMGFQQTMDAIIENLPKTRQTLLFSATQTKSIEDLARLSLNNAVYVAPSEQQTITPKNLQQSYVVINLEDKVTMLWSFIKSHLKQKCIVFLSTCKQVKYMYEIFCKLRPGISLLALYGTLHQDRRVAIYKEFCRKSNVVLFATDIASRGLDFPVVNWVIQLDCPEDVTQYIHRAGRTARHKSTGESLLVLLPSEEEGMTSELYNAMIDINKIHIDPKKLFPPTNKMESFLAQSKDLKETAQRAFTSYIKSVFLMKDKNIFNHQKLDINKYAKSLGLAVVPRIRFLERFRKKKETNQKLNSVETDYRSISDNPEAFNFNKVKNYDIWSDDSDEDLFKVKRKNHDIVDIGVKNEENKLETSSVAAKTTKTLTKVALAKRVLKKRIQANTKIEFNQNGVECIDVRKHMQSKLAQEYTNENKSGIDIKFAKKVLREEDKFDKQRFNKSVKAKHKVQKLKMRPLNSGNDDNIDHKDISEVDLSWLPDPAKLYSMRNTYPDSNSEETELQIDGETTNQKPENLALHLSKRLYSHKTVSPNTGFMITDRDESLSKKAKRLTEELSLGDAEMIAIQLLNK